jgi:PAS domain S-box-containing protein
MGLLPDTRLVETMTEAFRSIDRGERDFLFAPQLTGEMIIRQQRFANITSADAPVMPSIVCLAVRKGNADTLAALNLAIDALKQDGTLDRLNEQHLGDPEPAGPMGRLAAILRLVSLSLFGVLLVVAVWIWQLRRQIRRATTGLQESESRFRSLFETMSMGFAVHEMLYDGEGRPHDYRFLQVNPAFERLTGLQAADLIGRTVLEALPGTEEYWIRSYGQVVATGEPMQFEQYSGELGRHYEVIAYRPAPGLFAVIIADVSTRKRIELALRESEERYRLAIAAVKDGMWDWDMETDTVHWDDRAYTMLGYAPDAFPVSSRRWREMLHPDDREHTWEILQHAIETDGDFSMEFRLCTAEGGWHWIEGRGQVLERMEGKPQRMVGTHIDISERKKSEEEMACLEFQLRQEQKLAAVGTLAGGVAHEINNPLMGMINYAQLIHDRLPPDTTPLGEYCTEIIREGERIATIVRSLLSFSRQEQVNPTENEAIGVVRSILSLTEQLLSKEEIAIELDCATDLPPIRCVPAQIQQVLLNLLTNARDALNERFPGFDPQKRILLKLEPITQAGLQFVRITVRDTGKGIPETIRARVFDPFFTTKDRTRGTGLGLTISHQIAAEHGGQLSFDSTTGRGTAFYLDLPAIPDG